ncbi:hypothetical protein FHR81_000707 [Actinoalloteichus hoggarensis]|nr:hypothetical protein [Actinoalloteichus hoggarensis]MBB5919678.1 hypothetical protein [Actinoalloteichus hoggarensis]
MSELDDFRASREARREATRPGRHYDPGAYLAEQRIRESILLAGREQRRAEEAIRRRTAASRVAEATAEARAAAPAAMPTGSPLPRPGEGRPREGRPGEERLGAGRPGAGRPARTTDARHGTEAEAGAGVESGLRARRTRRAHAMPAERPARRRWFSLRRGHA